MIELLKKKTFSAKDDILSGITVALALVPEAVAFAFVAGVDPLVGLYAAFMVGLITSVFGGRPAMISGATGALAVVMVSLVSQGNQMGLSFENPIENAGLYYLFLTVILMGFFQILAGVFKLGKYVRLIPHPVMLGFVNGLAIVIFISQLGMFQDAQGNFLTGSAMLLMLGLVGLTMAIMYGLPKLTQKFPSALAAILVVSGIVITLGLATPTVGSFISDNGGDGLEGGLPTFQWEIFNVIPLTLETLYFILPYALILAAIGLIESLMTLNLLDEITKTRGKPNRECMAQGGANMVTGCFGGMGGCAMIGQSLINVNSGARGRLSGIIAALCLLLFILFLAQLIELIPIAALVGVMFMVVIGTFAWATFKILPKIPKEDAFVLVFVTVVTVFTDLAIAVISGVIISALVFAWKSSQHIIITKKQNSSKLTLLVSGPLFFGSVKEFLEKSFIEDKNIKTVVVDFFDSRIADHSAIEALENLFKKYNKLGITVNLKHLSEDCEKRLLKLNPQFKGHIVHSKDDPDYMVMTKDLE